MFLASPSLRAFAKTTARNLWFTGPKIGNGTSTKRYPHHYYYGPNPERWAERYNDATKGPTVSTAKSTDSVEPPSRAQMEVNKSIKRPFDITTKVWPRHEVDTNEKVSLCPRLDTAAKVWPPLEITTKIYVEEKFSRHPQHDDGEVWQSFVHDAFSPRSERVREVFSSSKVESGDSKIAKGNDQQQLPVSVVWKKSDGETADNEDWVSVWQKRKRE